jgi:hypothetical protein
MATLDFTTYAGLQAAIASFLNRSDLSGEIPGFIALAEAEITRRVRRKTITGSLNVASPSTALPADCAELRSARLVTGSPWRDTPLRVVTTEVLTEIKADFASSGRPIACTLIAGKMEVAPEPDQLYLVAIKYYEKLVPLSNTSVSNSVLADSPDVYLYGALKHSAPFLEHDERLDTWGGLFEAALTQLDIARQREETSASLRPARLPRVF